MSIKGRQPYTKVISPVNLLESTPPKVSSPFVTLSDVVGSKDIPSILFEMRPALKALSVTVGIVPPLVVVSNKSQS